MTEFFNIEAKKLNTTGQWYASVDTENRKVSGHELCSMVMRRTGIDRRTMEHVIDAISASVSDCLAEGAEVRLGNLLTISPTYQLRNKICGSREDVLRGIEELTPRDVRVSARVQLTHSFVYEMKNYLSELFCAKTV